MFTYFSSQLPRGNVNNIPLEEHGETDHRQSTREKAGTAGQRKQHHVKRNKIKRDLGRVQCT